MPPSCTGEGRRCMELPSYSFPALPPYSCPSNDDNHAQETSRSHDCALKTPGLSELSSFNANSPVLTPYKEASPSRPGEYEAETQEAEAGPCDSYTGSACDTLDEECTSDSDDIHSVFSANDGLASPVGHDDDVTATIMSTQYSDQTTPGRGVTTAAQTHWGPSHHLATTH